MIGRSLDEPLVREPARRAWVWDEWGTAPDGSTVTVVDRVVQAVRAGNYLHVAASAAGISREQLWAALRRGATVLREVQEGRELASFTPTEQRYADLAERVRLAEAELEVEYVAHASRLARGGSTKSTVTKRYDTAGNVVEHLERVETLPPDAGMLRWVLAQRFSDRWGRERIEVTGADGGPVEVDVASIEDRRRKALVALAVVGERLADSDAEWSAAIAEVEPAAEVPMLPETAMGTSGVTDLFSAVVDLIPRDEMPLVDEDGDEG